MPPPPSLTTSRRDAALPALPDEPSAEGTGEDCDHVPPCSVDASDGGGPSGPSQAKGCTPDLQVSPLTSPSAAAAAAATTRTAVSWRGGVVAATCTAISGAAAQVGCPPAALHAGSTGYDDSGGGDGDDEPTKPVPAPPGAGRVRV